MKSAPTLNDTVSAARLRMNEAGKVLHEVALDITSKRKFYPGIQLNDAALAYADAHTAFFNAFKAANKKGGAR